MCFVFQDAYLAQICAPKNLSGASMVSYFSCEILTGLERRVRFF